MLTLRSAKVKDLKAMVELINSFSEEQLLLPKNIGRLVVILPNYCVVECGGQVVGTCGFKIDADFRAEIISLAVRRDYQRRGIGNMLIGSVLKQVEDLGIKRFYTLTLRVECFEPFGFKKVEKTELSKKIWDDCIFCPRNLGVGGQIDCPEIAMVRDII